MLTIPENGPLMEIPMINESGDFVQTLFIRCYLEIRTCDPLNVERTLAHTLPDIYKCYSLICRVSYILQRITDIIKNKNFQNTSWKKKKLFNCSDSDDLIIELDFSQKQFVSYFSGLTYTEYVLLVTC